MTDAPSVLSHKIYDIPTNIRASLSIVRFHSLFLLSAFVLPRFTVSIAPHIQNRWIHTFSLPVVRRRRFFVDNARLFSVVIYRRQAQI